MYCIDCYNSLKRVKGNRCPACGCAFDASDPATYATATNTLRMRLIARTAGIAVFLVALAFSVWGQRTLLESTFGADYVYVSTDFAAGVFAVPSSADAPQAVRWTLRAPPDDGLYDAAWLPPVSGALILIQLALLAYLAYRLGTDVHRRVLFWLEAEAELNSVSAGD